MKKYLKKVFPYVLLVVIYLGFGEWMLFQSGELQPVRQIVKQQLSNDQPSHYQKGIIPTNDHIYLYEHLCQRQADIVVVGESITAQFQDRMFHPLEASFFNASNVFRSMDDLEKVIGDLCSGVLYKPKLIILGLDPSFLKITNQDVSYWAKGQNDPVWKINVHFRAIKASMHRLRPNAIAKNDPIIEPQSYGIFGQQGKGRRKDGSYDNVLIHQEYNDNPEYVERNNLKERLTNRLYPFELPMKLDEQLVDRFKGLVELIKEKDIELIFYCQQLSNDFMTEAQLDQDFMILWNEFLNLCSLIEKQGFSVIAPGTPEDIGLDDRYMRDASHAGEVMTAFQLLQLLEKKGAHIPTLRDIDLDQLRGIINKRFSELELSGL